MAASRCWLIIQPIELEISQAAAAEATRKPETCQRVDSRMQPTRPSLRKMISRGRKAWRILAAAARPKDCVACRMRIAPDPPNNTRTAARRRGRGYGRDLQMRQRA